ncbi:MAG: hypothetical protein K9N47_29360 [Prosthecobacter sp.]|uniref:hypothetical protein n=1 Tax=Prosthecobacter sp. TaxID=1965333 RepID=UPI002617BB3A|nr:hypothetical protein [Prosthecobacter sp.]MCF7790264.1 hypothetical protein [Prosthecobacter sp.]
MPKIRRHKLPRALIEHLAERILQREISVDQIGLFGDWCDTLPEVPAGTWFKRFPGMIACGEGELVKTFLIPGQVPHGEEVF